MIDLKLFVKYSYNFSKYLFSCHKSPKYEFFSPVKQYPGSKGRAQPAGSDVLHFYSCNEFAEEPFFMINPDIKDQCSFLRLKRNDSAFIVFTGSGPVVNDPPIKTDGKGNNTVKPLRPGASTVHGRIKGKR